ncbi:MAG: precorrin-6y C5,15-methyltransferase (decarboxylating) subunit CbiE [Lachnospiraceae bacterium]|nr:precorrin-6y C5,15-methyltransferase (decarboxylating) subunit CbiE [Lachnospiraceae bacterium]
MIYIIGMGVGKKELRTLEAKQALEQSDLIVGASRLLETLEDGITTNRVAEYRAEQILAILEGQEFTNAAILFSGDISFYSGARGMRDVLRDAGITKKHPVVLIPGISSIAYMCAKMNTPLEEVAIHSAHGVDCDVVAAVMRGKICFFLTGGEQSPAALCQQLMEAGLGALPVAIGERLSYEDERIATMTAEEGAKWDGAALAVLMVWPAPSCKRSTPGFADEAFIRGKVPMTKRMIRMSVLGLLNPQDDEVCWDVGAGTGSVSVELSMFARRVYAIEKKPEAVDLLRQNREEFCAYNMHIIQGEAPEALDGLETPDVVFIGGSSGRIGAILDCLPQTGVRLCVTAVTLETLEDARKAMESAGFAPQITQVAVTDIKPVGDYHMMDSQNPVFIIYGER